MERPLKSSSQNPCDDSKFIQNLRKKRPDTLKLDIEKLFQQSIELTEIHEQLLAQNKKLQKQYEKVENAKAERQKFIGTVEKIVKDKEQELVENRKETSWLAYKLQKKIDDLKKEISNKNKCISKLRLGKQNQILFRKQIELQCLKEIAEFAEGAIVPKKIQFAQKQECHDQQKDIIKNIVWMEDFLLSEEESLQKLQAELESEERSSKALMMKLAYKKSELKKMKEVIREYNKTQQNYQLEKMKKEEKMIGNKNYLSVLVKERDLEMEKMQQLKKKEELIVEEEEEEIRRLEQKLSELQNLYESNRNKVSERHQTYVESVAAPKKQEWVKKVSFEEIQTIARNINYTLRLKKVSQKDWVHIFFEDGAEEYSIENIMHKLSEYPFNWEDETERKLIARYLIQDQDSGFQLQNLETTQNAPIIKSILTKLIGDIKVYSQQQIEHLVNHVGDKLFRFSSLVEQAVQMKEGSAYLLREQKIRDGIEQASLELSNEEVDLVILYLFSWCKKVQKLNLKILGKLNTKGINWDLN